MSYTNRISEEVVPLGVIHAGERNPQTISTGFVAANDYHRIWAVIDVGGMSAGATVNAQIRQATDTAGTGAKTIADKATTGTKAITELTQTGGDANSIACIEVQSEELDVDNAFDCVELQIVVAVNNANVQGVLYGAYSRYEPVPTTNWAEVVD